MANLLSVAVVSCSCGAKECFEQSVIIDDINSELYVGGVFTFSGAPGNPKPIAYGCYEIRNLKSLDKPATAVIVSEYTDCETCLAEASNALRFNGCSGERGITIYLPKTSFSPLPTPDNVFFLDVYIDDREGGFVRVTSCFTFVGLVIVSPNILANYGLNSSTPYSDCQTCLSESPIIYLVGECVSGDEYYIAFPSNSYQGHLVTFTGLDGITQFCGVVEEIVDQPTTGLFVTDLGILEKPGNDCDTCLTNVAEKKKLVNCLDSEDILIAWASQLFEAGDVTNISINNSCYIISPDPVDPEEPITVPEFADFDPHAGCENCFECHGITLDFSSCTEVTVCGELSKYTFSGTGGYSLITDNNIAYLGFRTSGIVRKFDMSSNLTLATYGGFGIQPGKLGFDSTNKILAIPDNNTNFTRFVDTNTNVTTGITTTSGSQRPVSAYYNLNDNYFYVGVQNLTGNCIVNIYDASAFPSILLVNSITITELNTPNIEVIQVGANLFITAGNSIYIYDATTYAPIGNLSLGYTISSITYSPTTNKIFVVGQNNGVTSIDPISFSINTGINLFPACCANGFVFYDVTSNKLFVTFSNVNNLFEVNENTLTLSNTINITLSSQPNGIGVYNGDTYVLMSDTLVRLGCTSEFLNNKINSYEYIPVGDSFYHPYYDICCTVTNIRTDMDGEFDFYSLKSYSGGCSSCEAVSHELFTATGCDVPIDGLVVAESGQYSISDVVRSHWGNSNFLCFEIDGTYTPGDFVPSYVFETENEPSFSSCTECRLGATVGLTVINCNTRVESYVNVSLEAWSTIFGLNSLPNPSICDAQGNCYVVVNSCPIDNVYEEFVPTNFYFDCTACRTDNPGRVPRSANTENFVCVTCCPCDGSSGSTFSVTPPHPVWTDEYGTSVTQMNMIVIGGINGLNG
jgi:hypothetical protein